MPQQTMTVADATAAGYWVPDVADTSAPVTIGTDAGGHQVWASLVRTPTPEETNLATLQAQAAAAMATNRTAIAAPTGGVTLAQAVGQIKALSAQNNALIRIVLGLLDATN